MATNLWSELLLLDGESLTVRQRSSIPASVGGISTLKFAPDGKQIVGLHGDNYTHVGFWDAETCAYLGEAKTVCGTGGTRLSFSKDGSRVLAGASGRHLLDTTSRDVLASVPTLYSQACLSPDGSEVAAVRGYAIAIVDPILGVEKCRSSDWGSPARFATATVSADGKRMFAYQPDRLLEIDPSSGRVLSQRPFGDYQSIVASPTGDTIAVKSETNLSISVLRTLLTSN